MSKFADEILEQIYNDKDSWTPLNGGIEKGDIRISSYGNSALLSIIRVRVGGVIVPTTYWDCYHLEKAITWWYKNVSLETLNKQSDITKSYGFPDYSRPILQNPFLTDEYLNKLKNQTTNQ